MLGTRRGARRAATPPNGAHPPAASPSAGGSTRWTRLDSDLHVETTDENARLAGRVGAIERALRDAGSLTRDEVASRVGAAEWGTPAFARALRVACREDRAVYAGGRYFPDYDTAGAATRGVPRSVRR